MSNLTKEKWALFEKLSGKRVGTDVFYTKEDAQKATQRLMESSKPQENKVEVVAKQLLQEG